ncbi:MAG: PQQ-binding-like beta-propeller repeat protein [Armatimonadetes bacterium]|nr:PQQ-binding-like beta-propeller repeat protein [Armatimonadota bacterium]
MIQRLKRHLPIILTVAAALGVATYRACAEDWPTLGGGDRRTGRSEETIAPPLSLLWRYTGTPLSATAASASSPTVVGETAYFAGKNNPDPNAGAVLFALDTKTGSRRWVFPNDYGMKDKAVFQTAPVVNNGRIYIGASDGFLYILDAGSGSEINKIRTGGAVAGTPLIAEGTIYFGSNDNTVYAFDAETLTPSGNWRTTYKTNENINSALISADGYLFFTTADQNVHAVAQLSGKGKWRYRLPFKYAPDSLIYADNSLYIPTGPRLYAIQPTSGNVRWTLTFPGEILAPPSAADGVVFVSCRDSATQEFRMYAVKSSNNRTAWAKPAVLPAPPSAAATIVGDVIYVPTKRGIVVALSKEDGKTLWTYRSQPSASRASATLLNDATVTSPIAAANGALYIPTDDGSLSAFRPDAPDTTAPILSARYPVSAQSIFGGPGMVITGTITDPGSGLDTESLKMAIDGIEVTTGYNESLNIAFYQRPRSGKQVDQTASLSNGRHTVTLTAKDFKGNTLTETWSFVVDNNLKAPTVNYLGAKGRTSSANAAPPAPRGGNKPGGI